MIFRSTSIPLHNYSDLFFWYHRFRPYFFISSSSTKTLPLSFIRSSTLSIYLPNLFNLQLLYTMNTYTKQLSSTSSLTFITTTPKLFTSSINKPLTCIRKTSSLHHRQPLRMVSISRTDAKDYNIDKISNNSTEPSPTSAEIAAISTAVCEFMNKEHVRDIASYVINFGKKFVSFHQKLI